MLKKVLITLAMFALAGALVIGVGFVLEPKSAVNPISPNSPCPVAGCASGECHGFDAVPEPDGIHEMTCPEAGCADSDCHAWDTLQGRYKQASDSSLNIWILAPTALVVGLIVLIGVLSRPRKVNTKDTVSAYGNDVPKGDGK
ncbi:hypothetical protein [Adlercreutzia sp. ZJ138]|uniref:hypothetical protein n=1 Tax=Adlercreutzia sp. ZJ138 TaxID=2709405 RepID=UPI001F151A3D|nr:hypothetical protein [Adlercreutzia sp. ZJ138]